MAQLVSNNKKVAPKVEEVKQDEWKNTIGDYLWASKPEQYVALMNAFSKSKVKVIKE